MLLEYRSNRPRIPAFGLETDVERRASSVLDAAVLGDAVSGQPHDAVRPVENGHCVAQPAGHAEIDQDVLKLSGAVQAGRAESIPGPARPNRNGLAGCK